MIFRSESPHSFNYGEAMHKYEEKTFLLVSPICTKLGLELVEVSWVKEYNTFFLRIIIDKEGGTFAAFLEITPFVRFLK